MYVRAYDQHNTANLDAYTNLYFKTAHTYKHKNKIHTWSHVHNGSVSNSGCLSRGCLRMHCVSLWGPACMVVPLISSLALLQTTSNYNVALDKHSLMLLVKASRASNPNVGLLLHGVRRILLFQLSSHRVSYACCAFVGLPLSDLFGDASKTKWTQRARLRNRICHVNFSCCPHYNWLVVWNIFYFSHHIGNVIIPTDFHSIIFQRRRSTWSTTNQII